jgi:hypothetical protein
MRSNDKRKHFIWNVGISEEIILRAGLPKGWSSSPGSILVLSRPAMGSTQLIVQWLMRALSLGVKQQWREADHSPQTSAEVKKKWIYASTAPCASMEQCWIG